MKKFFSALLVVLFATSAMAQTGLTCEDPIPVDKSYTGQVDGACELWYTAWTYDLPIHVYFSPNDSNKLNYGPDVEIDFSCDGIYEDRKLDSIINVLEVMGLTLPVEFMCTRVVRNGKWEWDMSIKEEYRDKLTELGLTYNVQAFVKVRYYEGGSIRLTPDTAFQSCIDHGRYLRLGDTIDIAANDSATMLVLPYSEWKNDSIQFTWIGDEPARVWVAEDECRFIPVDASVYVKAKYDIDQNNPKKLYSSDMQNAIDNWIGAGIFYAKVLSKGSGRLVVERIPLGEIQGDAILLKHGESVALEANDERVFCFPKTWKSTEFLANTQYLMAMHVANTPDFTPGDANVISKYAFSKEGNNRQLQLTVGDISSLAASATDDYLYVRFVCNKATTLTPFLWNASTCLANTVLIQSNEAFAASYNTIYRMKYQDWAGYDFTINWTGRSTMVAYVSSYCDFVTTSTDLLKSVTVPARKSSAVSAELLSSWEASLESDGFLYIRLKSERDGNATFTSAKPAETDPEGPVLDPVYTTETTAVCFGEAYEWNGKTYTETGKYTYTTVAANGADSIVTLNLTVYPQVSVTEEVAAVCYGEVYTWQGAEYTESGGYSVTLQDVNGCDSIVTLALTVYPQTEATTETVEVPFGTTYEWNGLTYTESGEYTTTLQDENGCDYEATLLLTILPEEKPEFAYPVVASSDESLLINYPLATQVYGMEYLSWQAGDVTLAWSGATPLYVFIAKVADFAVAVHHKNVVKFIEVPAEGSVVLPKSEVQALNRYATEEGYLYVRFLTEKEGVLTTAQAE